MKRVNNLYQEIISIANLELADVKARKGKASKAEIKKHDKNKEGNIMKLHEALKNKMYQTSTYKTFTIFEKKERLIFKLPYKDRIVHHAVMNLLENIFVSCFTSDTYSCIKGKGIKGATFALRNALKDIDNTKYCLKLDIKKFYPNIDHVILKQLIRKKVKDIDLLDLLDGIIDSADGVPIGNYLSQYFANFYLTYFDHWIKENKKVKYYFRYADDIVILSSNKPYLHQILADIRDYFTTNLKLTIKDNYQLFPVSSRGIDFVGYVCFHTHTLLRPSIKRNYARMMATNRNSSSIASYKGWTNYADCKNLNKKLFYERN